MKSSLKVTLVVFLGYKFDPSYNFFRKTLVVRVVEVKTSFFEVSKEKLYRVSFREVGEVKDQCCLSRNCPGLYKVGLVTTCVVQEYKELFLMFFVVGKVLGLF